jgi:hypothetical protein
MRKVASRTQNKRGNIEGSTVDLRTRGGKSRNQRKRRNRRNRRKQDSEQEKDHDEAAIMT